MAFERGSNVVLVQDLPEERLYAGDIGKVVKRVPGPRDDASYVVEFSDLLGNVLMQLALSARALRVSTRADRPTVRVDPKPYIDDDNFFTFISREFDHAAADATLEELAEFAFGSVTEAIEAFDERKRNPGDEGYEAA